MIDSKNILPKKTYLVGAVLSVFEILGILPIFLLLEELFLRRFSENYNYLNCDMPYDVFIILICSAFVALSMLLQFLSNRYVFSQCWNVYPKLVSYAANELVTSKLDLTNRERYIKLIITETQQYVFSVVLSRLIIFSKATLILSSLFLFTIAAPLYTLYLTLLFCGLGFIVLPVYMQSQKKIGVQREKNYRNLFDAVGNMIGVRDEILLGFIKDGTNKAIANSSKNFGSLSARNSYNPQSLRILLESVLMGGIIAIGYSISQKSGTLESLSVELLLGMLALKLLPALQSILKSMGEMRSGYQSAVVIKKFLNECASSRLSNRIYDTEIDFGGFLVTVKLPNNDKNVEFTIKHKKINVIVGKSGKGKTTVIRAISGLSRFAGGSLTTKSGVYPFPIEWVNLQVSFVPQAPHFYYSETEFLHLNSDASVSALIDTIVDVKAGVSGGEKQRYSIARALSQKTSGLIVLDEPTSALDDSNFLIVMDALRSYANEGATLIAVSHDERLISKADHVINFDEV